MTRITPNNIIKLQPREVFVFGSNEAGRHGAGAAKLALDKFGARYGQGFGIQGSSFAIPTKDQSLNTLHLHRIQMYVNDFIYWAEYHTSNTFLVTEIGCGLAGYKPEQIAPLFEKARNCENIYLPLSFWSVLNKES